MPEDASIKTLNILLVDDMSTNRELIKACLNDPQYRINEAADGQQAINILKQQKFDVAILDVMMPGIDGIELCTYIRNMPTTEIIPIIMITSLNSMEDILEIEQAGATMYLERPFDAKKLRKLLSEVTQAKNASNR